ncbi:ArsR/SmtB family transcription factor [Paenibacillus soyae]|uniref:Metalloregulator ArsR/SmtB family transcription factor n=1 Tax=Paenibacillus soyae TaxID=2969249 RepID=A0A9X2MVF9_9BACL|nr:metalloregulator ArsR/SmtB family transcription factor [Paenibacillus soyae]MCR2807235.1 metalloregulator ArsR/SmtB family transcription factor [Paenibacillus soyae]
MELENDKRLDHIFHALSDSTRREMLRLMAQRDRTVSELAEPFDMSLAAASKHVKVLEHAGLLRRSVQGRTHYCSLDSDTMAQAMKWLSFYEQYWKSRFDALEKALNEPDA